jgi:hypothetical protein
VLSWKYEVVLSKAEAFFKGRVDARFRRWSLWAAVANEAEINDGLPSLLRFFLGPSIFSWTANPPNMYAGWNLVVTLLFLSLCGHGLGFWPFDVLASKDSPEDVYDGSRAKKIAIIGMYSLL